MADSLHNASATVVEQHPERHEHSDVNVRPLAIAGIIFTILTIAILFGLYILFDIYDQSAAREDASRERSVVRTAIPTAPPPQLPRVQGIPGYHDNLPSQDLQELRKKEKQQLESYSAADEPGFVRIPIDRAMQIIAANGIPATQPATQPSTQGGASGQR